MVSTVARAHSLSSAISPSGLAVHQASATVLRNTKKTAVGNSAHAETTSYIAENRHGRRISMAQSPSPRDVAQRGYALALRRLSELKAGRIADEMGVSDSTISEIKNKQAEQVILLLAHLGLRIVDTDAQVLPADAFRFLTSVHKRVMERDPSLVWGEDDE